MYILKTAEGAPAAPSMWELHELVRKGPNLVWRVEYISEQWYAIPQNWTFQQAAAAGYLYVWDGSAWQRATAPGEVVATSTGLDVSYNVHPSGCYGRRFRSTRPPGLPASVPCTSERHAAVAAIRQLARGYGLPTEFERTVVGLAENESGAEYYRPANSFDPRPIAQRPSGKSRITAYGVYQFNDGAWDGLGERKSYLAPGYDAPSAPASIDEQWPWEATAYEQIAYPVDRYAKLFSTILLDGGTPYDAAVGIRVWHSGSGRFRAYRRLIKRGYHMPQDWGRMRAHSPDWYDEHTPSHLNDLNEWLQSDQRMHAIVLERRRARGIADAA